MIKQTVSVLLLLLTTQATSFAQNCQLSHGMTAPSVAMAWLRPGLFDYSDVNVPHPKHGTEWQYRVEASASQREALERGPSKWVEVPIDAELKERFQRSFVSKEVLGGVATAAGVVSLITAQPWSTVAGLAGLGFGLGGEMADPDDLQKRVAVGSRLYLVEETENDELTRSLYLKVEQEVLLAVRAACPINDS